MPRPSKDQYYLDIARAVSERSPCIRRKVGAIVVVNDAIASTGYNGPARGVDNCSLGCLKDKKGAGRYSGYDWCPGVHAEENAIINAARSGVSTLGGTLFIVAEKPDGSFITAEPCNRCRRVLINAGIVRLVTIDEKNKIIEHYAKEWVDADNEWYRTNMKKA